MQFCADCAANMFQSVSQGRANPKVTLQDFKYISCAAFLPYFGGGTGQYESKTTAGVMVLHYVKGVGLNKAKIVWSISQSYAKAPPLRTADVRTSGLHFPWHSLIHYNGISIGTVYDSDKILPDLKIKENEVKMIVNVNLTPSFYISGKRRVSSTVWGMLILSPEGQTWGNNIAGMFHHFAIFTPKPGLFDETPPA